MKITPETWRKVEPLLTAALDLGPADREAWLATLAATQPEVAPLLARMLATHDRAERAREMETVPRLAPAPPATSDHTPGGLVGPFRLLRPLGRGGMGEVWLAEQADGRVARQVALKLPTSLEASGVRAERFARERDILAKLAHANIARLYDAGVTESGQPWLAMEHVEGRPFDDFLAGQSLPVAARVALFRQVLAAVAHAHRHLVVHRDLKPANILIDAAGQVKLLDFGIAKLLGDEPASTDSAGRDLTRLGGRVMTLRYAAPEQVAEATITTVTDIYSLGVILYEALAGVSPYRAVREARPLNEALLLQEDIALPSSVTTPRAASRQLSGDLDAILLKALRRDPGQRYASVEAFDDDLRRHLERRPVAARAGTWRYLAGRFALRNKLPLAVATAAVVSLAAGLVLVEQQRRIAVAERERAEKHFASVRKLANTLMFELHDKLQDVPGGLPARELLVQTSLQYLDNLSKEAGTDTTLLLELAVAYRKIGQVQGFAGTGNTGALQTSHRNLLRSKELFRRIEQAEPGNLASAKEHWRLSYLLARSYVQESDPAWEAEITETVRIMGWVAAQPGSGWGEAARVAYMRGERGHLRATLLGLDAQAREDVETAVRDLEALVASRPEEPSLKEFLATAYVRAGDAISAQRTPANLRSALDFQRKALANFEAFERAKPGIQTNAANVAAAYTYFTEYQVLLGEPREALASADAGLARIARLRAADPSNPGLEVLGLKVTAHAIRAALEAGDRPRALHLGRDALTRHAALPAETRNARDVRAMLAEARANLGIVLLAESSRAGIAPQDGERLRREARDHLAAARAFLEESRTKKLGLVHEDDWRRVSLALEQAERAPGA